MNLSKPNKVTLVTRVRGLIAGTQKHPPSASIALGGVTYTEAELVQTLQGLVDALAKVDVTRGGWKDALKSVSDVKAKVGPLMKAYRSWIVATYGDAPAILADYGIEPKARSSPTAETVAGAVAKRAATRKARSTMGPKQKASIKGTVEAPANAGKAPASPAPAAPNPAPAAPAVPATPAATGPAKTA
jgi:hypothetical protein